MPISHLALLIVSGAAAGFANSLAGGGTFITFPALRALGFSATAASATSTVGLLVGFGSAIASLRQSARGHWRYLWWLGPTAVAAGAAGAYLLTQTAERKFATVVPGFILLAVGLLAATPRIRAWLGARPAQSATGDALRPTPPRLAASVAIAVIGVYGGYFGAGMGVLLLAALGLTSGLSLKAANAVKTQVALLVNAAAAGYFFIHHQRSANHDGLVAGWAALWIALGAIAGGALGGTLADRIAEPTLRRIMVTTGVLVAAVALVQVSR